MPKDKKLDPQWLKAIIESARRDLAQIAPEIKAHSPRTRYERLSASRKSLEKLGGESTSAI